MIDMQSLLSITASEVVCTNLMGLLSIALIGVGLSIVGIPLSVDSLRVNPIGILPTVLFLPNS